MSAATVSPQPKKRHRGRNALIVIGVVLVVLIAGLFVVDGLARSYAQNLIETKVRSELSIPKSTPVDVTVEGASVLAQLATGKLTQVDVSVDKLSIGEVTGDAQLTARGIPIDQAKPIEGATLDVSTDAASLKRLLTGFKGSPITTVTINSGTLTLGATFSLFSLSIPVGVEMVPGTKNGELTLQPKSFTLNGAKVSAKDLSNTLGAFGADLTKTQSICVASVLPKKFHLDSIRLKGHSVQLAVSAGPVTLDNSLFTDKGTCP